MDCDRKINHKVYGFSVCRYMLMGLLPSGKTLSWEDTKKNADLVRKVGIQQLIAHYHRLKDRTNDQLKFGDEVLNPRLNHVYRCERKGVSCRRLSIR